MNRSYRREATERPPAEADLAEFLETPFSVNRPWSSWSRRSFLRLAGFGLAGGVLAGCSRAPIEKAVPLLVQPEEIIPGRATWYATTCAGCTAGCGLLAKTREGRPVKIDGWRPFDPSVPAQHPISGLGTCAVGQASLLGLYDSKRPSTPELGGEKSSWRDLDARMAAALAAAGKTPGDIAVLTNTITSPTTRERVRGFLARYPGARHVEYDALSVSAILDAYESTRGERLMPHHRFAAAEMIVSFDADFLGTWISPVEFSRDWAAGRAVANGRRSRHVQVEGRMSLTGTKADRRIVLTDAESGRFLWYVARGVARRASIPFPEIRANLLAEKHAKAAEDLAGDLYSTGARSLVVCGTNDIERQTLVAFINDALGAVGTTLDLARPSLQARGSDRDLVDLLAAVEAKKVRVLIIHGVDPAADPALGSRFSAALSQVSLVVDTSTDRTRTTALSHAVAPSPHFLERFDDAEPVPGILTITQPVISLLGDRRHFRESLAVWSGDLKADAAFRREFIERTYFATSASAPDGRDKWTALHHDGWIAVDLPLRSFRPFEMSRLAKLSPPSEPPSPGLELALFARVGMLSGGHAQNAWLHELPDPVTKSTWGNEFELSPGLAAKLGVTEGDFVTAAVRLADGSVRSLTAPAAIQPGQHDDVVAIALGYGKTGTERFTTIGPQWIDAVPTVRPGERVGVDSGVLAEFRNNCVATSGISATLAKAGGRREPATTQTYHTLRSPATPISDEGEPRPIVRETTLKRLAAGERASDPLPLPTLWSDDHRSNLPHWGMVIDLDRCTGCSACVVSCQVENNVPVVGRDEVTRRREMHWLRIDRYWTGEGDDIEAVHQPMFCQHCGNAPCESVCPVLATVHGEEGLNQQIYNRCVGTRYCANNCPYKVRRFNWFDYPHDDRLSNLALNPDVAVRSRGVMEKCSLCVQRIQAAKSEARRTGSPIADGAIVPACQAVCPTAAIRFGDLADRRSAVAAMTTDARHFHVLEELNVRPSVGYLAIVRADEEAQKEHRNG